MNRMGMQGFMLAAAASAGSLAHAQSVNRRVADIPSTRFTMRVENVSTPRTLRLPKGGGLDMPLSAGVWAVHTGENPILVPGQLEPGRGLKGLAEAGMADGVDARLGKVPGVRSHGLMDQPMMRRPAKGAASMGMAAMADGAALMPTGDAMLMTGALVEATFEARPGDRLSFAFMLGHSNDGLIGPGASGIALFDASGRAVKGDVSSALGLWDAGTEVNEVPGVGRNQGMRQGAASAGDPERRPVRAMSEAEFGRQWPEARRIMRVTLTPRTP